MELERSEFPVVKVLGEVSSNSSHVITFIFGKVGISLPPHAPYMG